MISVKWESLTTFNNQDLIAAPPGVEHEVFRSKLERCSKFFMKCDFFLLWKFYTSSFSSIMLKDQFLILSPLWCGFHFANFWGAVQIVKQLNLEVKIITLICDSGYKYFSSIYNDEWLVKNNLV